MGLRMRSRLPVRLRFERERKALLVGVLLTVPLFMSEHGEGFFT